MKDFNEAFKAFLNANELSQAQVAKACGLSASYISKTLNDEGFEYAQDVKNKLSAYMSQFSAPAAGLFVHTLDARGIFHRIELARENATMCAIAGRPGTGKTKALKEYCARHPEAVLFEGTGSTGAKNLVSQIAGLLGLNQNGTVDSLVREIAEYLKGSNRVLIIDEAENLKRAVLEIVRRIFDFSGCCVILAGTDELISNLIGAGKKDGKEYSQLFSRIGFTWRMKGLAHDKELSDLRAVCAAFGVVDDELVKFVYSVSEGRFRSIELLLRHARRLANANKSGVNLAIIKNAASVLML